MSDLNEKIEERWRSRRKKGYNWPRLIVMVLILVAIWYSLGILKRQQSAGTMIMSEVNDSLEIRTEQVEPNP